MDWRRHGSSDVVQLSQKGTEDSDKRIRLGGVRRVSWQDHAYTGRQGNAQKCEADTTRGEAWLQSDNFGWVGLDSLMDQHGCWSKQKTAVISATTT